jgi:hypothetical protein
LNQNLNLVKKKNALKKKKSHFYAPHSNGNQIVSSVLLFSYRRILFLTIPGIWLFTPPELEWKVGSKEETLTKESKRTISPFLFLVGAEFFSRLINREKSLPFFIFFLLINVYSDFSGQKMNMVKSALHFRRNLQQ